jgi:hypothetical protein
MKRTTYCTLFVLTVLGLVISGCGGQDRAPLAPTRQAPTPTVPAVQGIVVLSGVHLNVTRVLLDRNFPAGCVGSPPACTTAQDGYWFLSVFLVPVDLPEGQMLAYKNIPAEVAVESNSGGKVPPSNRQYDNATRNLILGFQVPVSAAEFMLQWPGGNTIALTVAR